MGGCCCKGCSTGLRLAGPAASVVGRWGAAMVNYMADPSKVLWDYLRTTRLPREGSAKGFKEWYDYGQLAMALEIVTLIKNLEQLPVVTDIGRQETISALQTLLRSMDLDEVAWEMYDRLCEWRRPKFHEIPVVVDPNLPPGVPWLLHGPALPDDGAAGAPLPRLPQGQTVDLSSSDAGLEDEPSPVGELGEWRLERRSLDEPATGESEE